MARLPEREKVAADLPEMAEFRPAMLDAWNRWRALDAKARVDLTGSARAIIMHDFIIAEVAKRLGDTATLHDKAFLKVFAIRGYSIRFKKHDVELVSRNQETKQVRAFMGQMPLDGIPTMYNLEVGYVLDGLGTEVVSTNLVCPNGYGNQPYWHIELHDEGYEFGEERDLFPLEPGPEHEQEERGARWKRRESGVIIPFERISKRRDD